MSKVTVVGAGNVGATCANVLAVNEVANEVCLIDIKEGFAEGKAMDIMQTAQLMGFDTVVEGVTNDYSRLVRAPVNSFEFHRCRRTPQVEYLMLSLKSLNLYRPNNQYSSFTAWTTRVSNLKRSLLESTASLIPKPNSALSSNNELAQAGPLPSLVFV